MLARPTAIEAVAAFAHQTLEPELAGVPEQVGADLALLEGCDEDAFASQSQQPRQVGLAQRPRQLAIVVAIAGLSPAAGN